MPKLKFGKGASLISSCFQPLPLLVAIAASLLSMSGCEDDPISNTGGAPLTINFTGLVSGQPLALESKTYAAPTAPEGFRLNRMSFYISEIELLSESNGTRLGTEISEVEYIELGPDGKAELRIEDVPQGNYDGIRLRLGITPGQDSLQPKDFPAGTPLARSEEYWVDWGSYVFMKLEGKTDTIVNGIPKFEQPFLYHLGRAAEFSRVVEIDLPITVVANAGASAGLRWDIGTLLGLNSTNPLPVNGAIDHRNDFASRLMDNAERSLLPTR